MEAKARSAPVADRLQLARIWVNVESRWQKVRALELGFPVSVSDFQCLGPERPVLAELPAGDEARVEGWLQGAVSTGVIIHGDSRISGHGPGCQTVITSGAGRLVPKVTPNANIDRYLGLGAYRKKR